MKLKIFSLLLVSGILYTISLVAQSAQGPTMMPQLNRDFYVGQVNGFYPTIQSAVTVTCAMSSGPGALGSRVIVSAGSPADGTSGYTISAVAGGCAKVPIIDQRAQPATTCSWGGSAYSCTSGSGGGATIAHTSNVIKGDGTGNGLAATPGTDYVIPSGTVANATTATTAGNLSGTPALPNGSTASTQAAGDASGALATDAFVAANANCPLTTATNICITRAPYYASTAGATTTTTSGTFGVGTSGFVASCSTFTANEGVLITDAGASGANYIGTVVSCSGTTLTVRPATSTTVANSTVVQHDETAAILAGITAAAAAGSGTLWFPDGTYLVNGPLQDTSGANAVLPLPKIANYSANMVSVGFRGFGLPVPSTPTVGAVIQTSVNSGNLIAGFDSATGGGFEPLTNVWLDVENLTFVGPSNPGIVMINAQNALDLTAKNLLIEAPGVPSNTSGGALYYPIAANGVRISVDNVAVGGFYTGFILGEHSQTGKIYAASSHNCFVFDVGNNVGASPLYHGNSVSVDYLWAQDCVNEIVGGSNPTTINVQNADMEAVSGNGIFDPTNVLFGIVNFYVPAPFQNTSFCNANINGAVNLNINALHCTPITPLFSNLVENWQSQEGSGSTLNNSGSDSSNSATATAVTWTTPTGFAAPVATYNGTTSFSVASTATGTAFTGSTPFTACAWVNPTTANPSAYILSNLQTAIAAAPGWRMGILAGALDVYLIHDSSATNYIHVHGLSNFISGSGAIFQACFTYDGSSSASGVALYVNGAAATVSIDTNALSGAITSTTPLYIGSEADFSQFFQGSIGRVRIYNTKLTASQIALMFAYGPSAY